MKKRHPKTLHAVGDKLVCRRIAEIEDIKDAKGNVLLHLADTSKRTSLVFEVLHKGPICTYEEITVGCFVYAGRFAPYELNFPGHPDWVILREEDVLGVVKEFTDGN